MNNPLLVFENIHTTPRRQLFVLLGTPWRVTPLGWLLLPVYFLPGFLLTFWLLPSPTAIGVRVAAGSLAGVAMLLTTALHEVGHLISARSVDAPVTEIYLAAIRPLTLYHDQQEPARRVHLVRALGGPLFNGLLALMTGAGWQLAADALPQPYHAALVAFFLANLLYGLGSLLPLPSVDGNVIWRNWLKP